MSRRRLTTLTTALTTAFTLAVSPASATGSYDAVAGSLSQVTGSVDSAAQYIAGSLAEQDSEPADQPGFDLQSHRGGRGEWTEQSATAFRESLKLDVTTLELDIVLSEDKKPVVWHDPKIQADKCDDTQPATADDPEFPYVGKLVHELNWEQLQTLDCDKVLAGYPDAQPVVGNKLIQLQDVFDIAKADPQVRFNIETKIEAENRADSATPEEFVNTIVPIVEANDAVQRTAIQSFDWRSLPLVREKNPALTTVALYDQTTWVADSPWTGAVNFNDVQGDIVAALQALQVDVASPAFKLVTQQNTEALQQAGFQVIPWTVNEASDIERMIDAGVDGLITDYPTRAKQILNQRGIRIA